MAINCSGTFYGTNEFMLICLTQNESTKIHTSAHYFSTHDEFMDVKTVKYTCEIGIISLALLMHLRFYTCNAQFEERLCKLFQWVQHN